MESPDLFLGQLADVARSLQEKTSTQEMLDEAVQVAIEIIEGCDLAGMSIVNPRGVDTPCGGGDAPERPDSSQFELKEEPCVDALQTHDTRFGSSDTADVARSLCESFTSEMSLAHGRIEP